MLEFRNTKPAAHSRNILPGVFSDGCITGTRRAGKAGENEMNRRRWVKGVNMFSTLDELRTLDKSHVT
jgi:hypothetical protein